LQCNAKNNINHAKSQYTFTAKVNFANSKVNNANIQYRHSGILFAQANGKLCFEVLKTFSVPENHLPCREQNTAEVGVFLERYSIIHS
jgi:hypothetical protein